MESKYKERKKRRDDSEKTIIGSKVHLYKEVFSKLANFEKNNTDPIIEVKYDYMSLLDKIKKFKEASKIQRTYASYKNNVIIYDIIWKTGFYKVK